MLACTMIYNDVAEEMPFYKAARRGVVRGGVVQRGFSDRWQRRLYPHPTVNGIGRHLK